MKNLRYTFLFLLLSNALLAQFYPDCFSALPVCDKSPLHFELNSSEVGVDDLPLTSTCLQAEFGPTWLTWEVQEAGALTFVITPDTDSVGGGAFADIDFALFLLPNSEGCGNAEMIRCMASGESVGAPMSEWIDCMGPTGLAVGETDFETQPGCAPGANAFLAPLVADVGNRFALLVNNFSLYGGFTIQFDGSMVIGSCSLLQANDKMEGIPGIQAGDFSPNPVFSGTATLPIIASFGGEMSIRLIDSFGKLVGQEKTSLHAGLQSVTVDAGALPAGLYFVTFEMNGAAFSKKLLRL